MWVQARVLHFDDVRRVVGGFESEAEAHLWHSDAQARRPAESARLHAGYVTVTCQLHDGYVTVT